jgi:two-component system OmpR family response regulator
MRTPESIYVFLVDDNKLFQQTLEQHLRNRIKLPISFMRFSKGEECLANLWMRPDLVILDYQLNSLNKGAMTGMEVLDKIRKSNPFTPVVMISGHVAIETAAKAIECGAIDFLEKNNQIFKRVDHRLQTIVRAVLLFGLPTRLHFWIKQNKSIVCGAPTCLYIRSRTFFSPIDLPEAPPQRFLLRTRKKRSLHPHPYSKIEIL